AGGAVVPRGHAQLLLDPLLDLVGHVGVGPQEVPRVLLALAELGALVGVPGPGLAHDPVLDPQVDQAALAGNPDTVQDIKFRLFERRRYLVLHYFDTSPVSYGFRSVLRRFNSTDVHSHGSVEFQRPAAGRGLGAVVHHHTVDEVIVV